MPTISTRAFALWLFLVAVVFLLADQVSKAIVVRDIREGDLIDFLGPLRLTLFYNDGIAFGIGGVGLAFVSAFIAIFAMAFLISSAPQTRAAAFAGGMILGGAIGNMADRISRGAVVDFFSFPGWPVFNIADVGITVGVPLLIFLIIRAGAKKEARAPGKAVQPGKASLLEKKEPEIK